jgi:tetratricopeptide (TPR) repeat protein
MRAIASPLASTLVFSLFIASAFAGEAEWKARYDAAVAARTQLDFQKSDGMFSALAGDLEEAVKAEQATDANSEAAATAAYWLGSVYLYQGREKQASAQLGNAYDVRAKRFGEDSLPVAQVLEKLVWLVDDEAGDRMLARVLRVREKVLGPNHREVADTHRDIALRKLTERDYGEAEKHYDSAILIMEKVSGPQHYDMVQPLSELAWLNVVRRRNEDAIPLYRRALAITEKSVAPDDPRLARALEGLGYAYYGARRMSDAEEVYLKALAIREKANGPNNMLTLTPVARLLDIYVATGKSSGERAMRKRLEAVQK